MRLYATRRQEPWFWGSCLVVPVALALSLALCGLLLAVQGKPALLGLAYLADGAFGSAHALQDTVLKAVPIYLCALGVAVAFRMQVWNIGAEGQFALGAVGATFAVMHFSQSPAWVLLPMMFLCAGAAGGLYALIPALLKTRLRVNEIITTLMLNYIGINFLHWLVYGPWKDPTSFGFPMTPQFPAAAFFPRLPGTRLHLGVVVCVLAGLAVWLWLSRTRLGYEIKASGLGPAASRYARMPYGFLVCLVMVVCGALAGLAGLNETAVSAGRLQPSVMAGYGYTAIVVAWLARLNPLAIGLAALFVAGLRVGVEALQLSLQVPAAFGGIMEGLILLTVLAGQFVTNFRFRIDRGPR